MADQFIGVTVFLTMTDPDRTQLRGLVTEVVGQELGLSNVFFPKTGHVMTSFRVGGPNIQDIDIVDKDYVPPRPPAQIPLPAYPIQMPPVPPVNLGIQRPPPQYYNAPPPYQQQNIPPTGYIPSQPYPRAPPPPPAPTQPAVPAFEDPAIVSMTRKPPVTTAPRASPQLKPPPPPPNFAVNTPTRAPVQPVSSAMSRAGSLGSRQPSTQSLSSGAPLNNLNIPKTTATTSHPRSANAALETARVQQQFKEMSLRTDAAAESSAFDETDDAASSFAPPPKMNYNQRSKFTGKRSRRGKGSVQKSRSDQFLEPIQQEESVVLQPGMFAGAVAQAAAASTGAASGSAQLGANRKKSKRRQRYENGHYINADEEGWATEDVTDFKETEFDFQGNLDRFDKKSVFSQIKAKDTTAEEARLVSFNRLPRRDKVPPRKNYRNTENVLGGYANGQSLADREGWQAPEFNAVQSEDTDDEDEDELIRGRNVGAADSGRSSRRAMSRQSISNRLTTRQLSSSNIAGRGSADNLQALSSSGSAVMNKPGKPSFRLAPSNRPCPVVSPLQMLDVERIAEVELGLTDDMMTENGGRGIATVAIQAFGKRISASNHNALPVVLVFAGNNKSGSRAIAAGRHLKNHHVRVMVCVLGLEREDELLENVRRQLNIFRNAGGKVARWEEMQSNIKVLDSPPELIIDGLLGMHLGFEDLRTDDQATAFEMVQFANKSKASVLSVDIPSGVDGSTGDIAQLEDTDAFYMRAKWVVCMGAPKSGLLNAIVMGVGAGWNLSVADIGISGMAWRKYGTRRRHGVEFCADWIVQLNFHSGVVA
ncbi:YjeF N-terminal domain-like protein [Wilcoxina mikolae CBS 423.85]|nr:YjeF N-terminal domain-like protein [Wilcoxina mikolae CBS 423.85]